MQLSSDPEHHLTYCSNIHAGELWSEVSANLAAYVPRLKRHLAPDAPFGIGLRLSNEAAVALVEDPSRLQVFRTWLAQNGLYVFTLNGFPYGSFHGTAVKDRVYAPDWRTRKRVAYTRRLIAILGALRSKGEEGSISTSPISYKPWFATDADRREALRVGARHLAELALELHRREAETGVYLHLDLEPEPDCLIENVDETVAFFTDVLVPEGTAWLAEHAQLASGAAEKLLRRHIQICFDTCHFAVEFDDPARAWRRFEENGIGVGKVQLSAALHVDLPDPLEALHAGAPCRHLEIETYTWEVLPPELRKDLGASILDEYRWVLEAYDRTRNATLASIADSL